VAFTLFVIVPLVPVIVSVNVPFTESLVEIVSLLDPEVVIFAGENDAVAPEGTPATAKLTVPVNPLNGETETLYEVLPPLETVREDGERLSVKFAAAV
jgi:hypothetical protein